MINLCRTIVCPFRSDIDSCGLWRDAASCPVSQFDHGVRDPQVYPTGSSLWMSGQPKDLGRFHHRLTVLQETELGQQYMEASIAHGE